MHKFQDWYIQFKICNVPLLKKYIRQRHWTGAEIDWIWKSFFWTSIYIELPRRILQAVHCIGWNNCSLLKYISSRMDVNFLVNIFRLYIFRLYPKVHSKPFHIFTQKNLVLSACYCWDRAISLGRWNKNFCTKEILLMELVLGLCFVTAKYSDFMQYYMMLLDQFDYKPVKDLATAIWLVKVQTAVCLVTWRDYYFVFT